MKRTLFMSAIFAVSLSALPISTFAGPTFAAPSAVEAVAPQSSAVVDAYMQALIQKCLDNGVLLPEQVQVMTDDELQAALTNCASTLRAAQSAPAVRRAPVVVQDPPVVVQRRRERVIVEAAPAVAQEAPSQIAVGNNSGNGNGLGSLGDVLGGLGGLGGGGGGGGNGGGLGGGGLGGGGNGGGAGGGLGGGGNGGGGGGGGQANAPAVGGLDGRIAGLQSGIQEGIKTGALTPTEAGLLSQRLGQIQATRANLGDTPTARQIVQQQLDGAVADFNSKVHNNVGIPNPDLFRSLKRNGATAAAGAPGTHSRFAAMRARIAAANGGQTATGSAAHSRMAAIRARAAAAQNGRTAGRTGNNSYAQFLKRRHEMQARTGQSGSRRCFRAPCNVSAASNAGSSLKRNRLVQRRIVQ
ncbi:MAG: hypothetical protein AB7U78_25765, partial [Hyphomicrobiaceae bacterium]